MDHPVTINMMGFKRADEMSAYIDGFKAVDPNVTIQYQSLDASTLQTTLQTQMVGGVGPDIFGNNGPTDVNLQQFVQAGYVEDLSSQPYLSALSSGTLDQSKMSDGKVYAIPTAIGFYGVYYNKDQFAQAGITDVPKTWADFLTDCDKLVAAGFAPIGGGYQDGWTLTWIVPMCMMANLMPTSDLVAQEMKYNSGEMKYTDQTGWKYQVLSMFSQMAQKGYFLNGSLGLTLDGGTQAFAAGKCSMVMVGNFETAQVLAVNPNLNMGVFALPTNQQAASQLNMSGAPCDFWSINASAKPDVKQAAEEFFAYMMTVEGNSAYATSTVQFPTVQGATVTMDDPHAQSPTTDFSQYLNSMVPESIAPAASDATQGYGAAEVTLQQAWSTILDTPNTDINQLLAACDTAYAAAQG